MSGMRMKNWGIGRHSKIEIKMSKEITWASKEKVRSVKKDRVNNHSRASVSYNNQP